MRGTLCLYMDDAVPRRLYELLNTPVDDGIGALFGSCCPEAAPSAPTGRL